MAREGDKAATNEIIAKYEGLIGNIAGELCNLLETQYDCRNPDFDDLNQEGNIGLLEAIKSYPKKEGISFSDYVEKMVREKVISFLNSENNYLGEGLGVSFESKFESIDDVLNTFEEPKDEVVEYFLQESLSEDVGRVLDSMFKNDKKYGKEIVSVLKMYFLIDLPQKKFEIKDEFRFNMKAVRAIATSHGRCPQYIENLLIRGLARIRRNPNAIMLLGKYYARPSELRYLRHFIDVIEKSNRYLNNAERTEKILNKKLNH